MNILNVLKGISLSSLLSLTTLVMSLSVTESATSATWNYVKCIAVQNDAGPLSVTSGWPETSKSWYFVNGNWGNASTYSGTLGNGGWMNYFRLDNRATVDGVKNECEKFLNSNSNLTIYPVAQFTSTSFQWPLVNSDKTFFYLNGNKYFGPSAQVESPKSASSFMNYDNLLTLAQAAYSAYFVTEVTTDINFPRDIKNEEFYGNLLKYKVVHSMYHKGDSQATAIALYSQQKNILIISYRGTHTLTDVGTDAQLMVQNFTNGGLINSYIAEAYNFYTDSKSKVNTNPKVILTGHSLGAYIANIIAMKTGEIARVFSSPANYIVNHPNPFANVMSVLDTNYVPTPNVINFAMTGDPVVIASGRHVSSEIFFQGTSNPLTNHKLETLFKHLKNNNNPTHVYLNPDAILYNSASDPITLQVNYQGQFPAP